MQPGRLIRAIATIAMTCACVAASPPAPRTEATTPPLVVLVVIDQLGSSLMERYSDLYKGGFRRLLDSGRVYMNASHAHAATVTAVGHAALATGVHPSRHGIVANLWYEASGGRWVPVENIADTTVKIVGFPALRGASPANLVGNGVADWLIRSSPRSLIASVSGKDRGAILPATRAKGHVYWFEGTVGKFVTSTYYTREYPAWVREFNETKVPLFAADSVWRSKLPASLYSRTKPDTVAAERDGVNTFFPHSSNVEAPQGQFWAWFESTPAADVADLQFAELMVSALGLGKDESPDYLNVALSATDAIGHVYGPHSREQLDNLLRLDARLGDFFDYLDRTVGKGRWTVAFSSDHGVVDFPEDLIARGEYGHRLTAEDRTALGAIMGRIESGGATAAAKARAIAELKRLDFVADAWTHEQLARATTDSFAVLARRSLYRGRAASDFGRVGIELRLKPGVLGLMRGTSHGSPYWYDRNVPMIFMGPGISAGRDPAFIHTIDMAPTLARLLGIPVPGGLDGRVVSGVTR